MPPLPPTQEDRQRASAALAAAPYAGLVVLGVGDAVASLAGVHFGRTRWPRTKKTLEGSASAVAAMMLLLVLILQSSDAMPRGLGPWAALGGTSALAAVLEAATSQIDNLFLPLFYQTLLLMVVAGGGQ